MEIVYGYKALTNFAKNLPGWLMDSELTSAFLILDGDDQPDQPDDDQPYPRLCILDSRVNYVLRSQSTLSSQIKMC